MNPKYFGDSYDMVKVFFIRVLIDLDYCVYVDPRFTGDWEGLEEDFFRFIGASKSTGKEEHGGRKTALLLDPDTGIGKKKTKEHVTISEIAEELAQHAIVFSFDKSFSRNRSDRSWQMKDKLKALKKSGAFGFYYDSQARFLFASEKKEELNRVREAILKLGLPSKRLGLLPNCEECFSMSPKQDGDPSEPIQQPSSNEIPDSEQGVNVLEKLRRMFRFEWTWRLSVVSQVFGLMTLFYVNSTSGWYILFEGGFFELSEWEHGTENWISLVCIFGPLSLWKAVDWIATSMNDDQES